MTVQLEGWYVDAMEQNLGMLIDSQRRTDIPIEVLVQMMLNRTQEHGGQSVTLSPEDHTMTLALCLAICVRRLARVDMP